MLFGIPNPAGGAFLVVTESMGFTTEEANIARESPDSSAWVRINNEANRRMNRLSTIEPMGQC